VPDAGRVHRRGDGRRALSLRSRLALLLGGVAGFLLITLGLQLLSQTRLARERDDLIDRIDGATEAVGDLRSAVVDQEMGVRGYALSDDEALFLEPYERGGDEADDAIERLRTLIGDTPSLAAEVDTAADALATWRREAAEPVLDPVTAAQSSTPAALEDGLELFERLRSAIDVLDAEVERERDIDREQLDDAYRLVMVFMFLQVVGIIVLGAVISLALSRQVLRPLARLGEDARRVASGEVGHRVVGRGAPELVSLGGDVEAMRSRIVAELGELTEARAGLERQTEELVRSNDDLEQFAYVASHDLQEPLRKVSGFCQLLEKRYADQLDDRAREYIWYASDGARRMQDLINDLLAFSRVGRTTEAFEDVDLGEVAAEVVSTFAEVIEATGATVRMGDLPTVRGDRRLLAGVLQNLVGNALKFHGDDPPVVELSAVVAGDEWTISVTDNGIGIEPAYAEQIFTIFKRLHNKTEYEGTGIGLALSKKIVEFHGGRIWLADGSGPGATFCFTLPIDAVPPTATEESDDDTG
jgi:hypothetical protein